VWCGYCLLDTFTLEKFIQILVDELTTTIRMHLLHLDSIWLLRVDHFHILFDVSCCVILVLHEEQKW
jgi:hypothetical protein